LGNDSVLANLLKKINNVLRLRFFVNDKPHVFVMTLSMSFVFIWPCSVKVKRNV